MAVWASAHVLLAEAADLRINGDRLLNKRGSWVSYMVHLSQSNIDSTRLGSALLSSHVIGENAGRRTSCFARGTFLSLSLWMPLAWTEPSSPAAAKTKAPFIVDDGESKTMTGRMRTERTGKRGKRNRQTQQRTAEVQDRARNVARCGMDEVVVCADDWMGWKRRGGGKRGKKESGRWG